MKWMYCILACLFLPSLSAQSEEGEEALQQVLEILLGEDNYRYEELNEKLMNGAWEALAYLEEVENREFGTEHLQEAVPDYYHFRKDEVLVKLINPENHNEYGMELKMRYEVNDQAKIVLYNSDDILKAEWRILYLDEFYMALDMGYLRIFFTHSPPQE